MRRSYLDYAMSVIVSRALPDVRDGLKPVHRRILYSMHENGHDWNKPYRKSRADRRRRDGQVPPARRPVDLRRAGAHGAGLLHARAADRRAGQLRLGRRRSAGGHALHRGAPAPRSPIRYSRTSTRTPSISATTTTAPSSEPVVLPARFPNLLVNGAGGIAVGMATNIPPHNLGEVIDADDGADRQPGARPSSELMRDRARARISRPAASSSAAPASARPTRPGAARS